MPTLSVPIIELQPFFSGTTETKAAVSEAVGADCRDIGFLLIPKHPSSPELTAKASADSEALFAQPWHAQMVRPHVDAARGFSAVGEEGLSYALNEVATPDLKGSLWIGASNVPDVNDQLGPSLQVFDQASGWVDVDLMGRHMATPTPQIVAQERGKFGSGHHRDLSQFTPKATICSSVWLWDKLLSAEITHIIVGK